MLHVLEAQAGDEADVVALWQRCALIVAYNNPQADFRFAQQGVSSAVLIGRDMEGKLRGSVMVGHDGHRGWLYYVAADPGRRRIGIGRDMVRAAEAWLQARGVMKVQLLVRETNHQVVAFYERLGFAVTPRIVMAKWLSEEMCSEGEKCDGSVS